MDVDTEVLNLFFRRIPPEQILRRMRLPFSHGGCNGAALLLRYAPAELGRYSTNEQEIILRHIRTLADEFCKQKELDIPDSGSLPALAFLTLIRFGTRVLTTQMGEPLCKTHEIGLWRRTYLKLGQDLLVCAYLAWEDFQKRQTRRNFAWLAVLRTDHKALNAQLDQGLAENHYHLYGSTQTFPLSWCSLMNNPEDLETSDWGKFDQFLEPVNARSPEDCLFSSKDRVRYAAYFRSALFRVLHPELEEDVHPLTFHPEIRARRRIRTLLHLYGAQIPQPNGWTDRLDYALEEPIFRASPDAPYRCLAGERSLLYHCFLAFLEGRLCSEEQQIFYLYLVLKLQFRSELLQVNQQIGFQNFQDYQDRKGLMIRRDSYWVEAIRMGINAPLNVGSVTSLETRIVPHTGASQYVAAIRDIDRKKHFADEDSFPERPVVFPTPQGKDACEKGSAEWPYFFVVHFLKRAEKSEHDLSLRCRHQDLRNTVQHQAIALAKALSNSAWLCGRVRGIDSSSNEIGCPPEVFASAYRFLRDFQPQQYVHTSPFREVAHPRLSATYHVGEDFLELASSLRAIDESVVYLELQRNDRLGHALGLGIDPEEYYTSKGRKLYVTKQDRLDDLVWLLYRAPEFGTEIGGELRSQMAKEAEILLLDIYRGTQATLLQYHCAMQLRGDDPGLYRTKIYKTPQLCSHYEQFQYSRRRPELETYRKTEDLVSLYYRYHFDHETKKIGAQAYEVQISPAYLRLMYQVQDKLQARLALDNIIIECNPSSNVLIGTFREYAKHPIFRFCDTGLSEGNSSTDLQVCINTDDLGVFDTSLAFEYALLFDALDHRQENDGSRKYRSSKELQYLKGLQDMGHMAVFPGCQNKRYMPGSDWYHSFSSD